MHFSKSDIILADSISSFRANFFYEGLDYYILRSENFNDDFEKIRVANIDHDIIYIPIEEDITLLFYDYLRQKRPLNVLSALPSERDFRLSRNKEDLNLFCANNGIPAPKYYNKDELLRGKFETALIVKPKIGSGSEGIRYINAPSEMKWSEINFDHYFVQEQLPNSSKVEAGFFLCQEGDIVSFYSHERLRTFPSSGGVSVLSRSSNNVAIKKAGLKVIQELKWSGFLMIEFIKDEKNNQYKLIEINPRLWGSVMLSEFNNSNFLKAFININLNKKIRLTKINPNVYLRWVFPYDLLFIARNPLNIFDLFRDRSITCYVNFTYSNKLASYKFIFGTYFNLRRVFRKLTK